jgi:hypothetical protein
MAKLLPPFSDCHKRIWGIVQHRVTYSFFVTVRYDTTSSLKARREAFSEY